MDQIYNVTRFLTSAQRLGYLWFLSVVDDLEIRSIINDIMVKSMDTVVDNAVNALAARPDYNKKVFDKRPDIVQKDIHNAIYINLKNLENNNPKRCQKIIDYYNKYLEKQDLWFETDLIDGTISQGPKLARNLCNPKLPILTDIQKAMHAENPEACPWQANV